MVTADIPTAAVRGRPGRAQRAVAWSAIAFLVLVVVVFAVLRVLADVDNIGSGAQLAESDFDKRYADHPLLAYLHIVPGLVYLLLAPAQIARSIRRGRIDLHRRLGRVLVVSGLVSGLLAIVLGVFLPFGGLAEASASAVFGLYFVVALTIAYRRIRARDVAAHRRWMIRAFGVATGIGTIRVLVGLSEAFGIATFEAVFGPAFWIAFALHAVLAEGWIRSTGPTGIRLPLAG